VGVVPPTNSTRKIYLVFEIDELIWKNIWNGLIFSLLKKEKGNQYRQKK